MKNPIRVTNKPLWLALRLSLLLTLALLVFGSTSAGQAAPPPAQSPPPNAIIVNNLGDIKKNDDTCTLREAIIAANSDKRSGARPNECPAGNGPDTIILPAGTFILSLSDNGNEDSSNTGDLDISSNVTIIGAGSGDTIIDANGISDRAFHILSGQVSLSGVTITKTGSPFSGNGAGIYNRSILTLENVTVDSAHASGRGGAIFNEGILTAFNTTISNNIADDRGGGIANASSGSIQLNNSTASHNRAGASGGGIYNEGLLALHNNTIAFNQATQAGGGIFNATGGGTVNIRNTIVARNTATTALDCSGTLYSLGFNLIQNSCTLTNETTSNIIGVEPRLDDLRDNGGETLTHALRPGSPAIDAGDPTGCFGSKGQLAFDQRGEPRPMDGNSDGSFLCDIGAYEVGRKTLALLRAFTDNNNLPTVHGLVDGAGDVPVSTLNLKLFANDVCDPSNPGTQLVYNIPASFANTDANGYFIVNLTENPGPKFITATAIGPNGVALQSNCVPYSAPNDAWPSAVELFPNPTDVREDQYIDSQGQSRWYKFKVEPNSELSITLSGIGGPDNPLPADFDLTLYGDIQAAFESITDPAQDIVRLSAEYAGSSYSGSSYSGSSYSGSSYSGSSYSGSSYSGSSYSGSSYSGSSYSGSSYSGSSYSGSSYSGDTFIGSSYSGSSYSGSSYSGSSYSGSSYSEAVFGGSSYSQAYSDAQDRTVLAVSAIGGTAPESILVRTWNNSGYYWLRVRSSNGQFSLDDRFRIEVTLEKGACGGVPPLPETEAIGPAGNPTTLILYDSSRLNRIQGSDETDIVAKLNQLASATGVEGMLVNVNDDPRVRDANTEADKAEFRSCPYAKNLVAQAIKAIIDGYRLQPDSKLKYVIIVGGDAVIPFFRHPDTADLAKESQFVPPVRDDSPSQAALRLDYVLTQDTYVARDEVQLTHSTFPVIDSNVAIGRLVETAADIRAVIDAYISTGGVVQPQSSLVSGYDFLFDATTQIQGQLEAGTGQAAVAVLPGSATTPPEESWSADQLRAALLPDTGQAADLIFLGGHFSGHSALAADYTTELFAAEVAESDVDMRNSIIFSIGCHAGYNIVNQDEVPGVNRQPDWAQAFAGKGAALIAGTGYQYAETTTLEYSERLYLEFSKKLRANTGAPVSIGHALSRAKLAYLTQIPQVRGLHEKALLEATLFGIPNLKVNMPHRLDSSSEARVIDPNSLLGFNTNPGAALGLKYTDFSVTPSLNNNQVDLQNADTGEVVIAEFLNGRDGVVTFPQEPFLPLEIYNMTVPNMILRGVGFRGGQFADINNILPLTGAPTTESVALHLSWLTDYPHPTQIWNTNYLGTLIDGETRLLFTPAQHLADPDNQNPIRKSIRREFSDMNFRLFYSNNIQDFNGHVPALSAPPAILRVSAIPGNDEITFRITAAGDPAAGIQSVWVTWTNMGQPANDRRWQSIDLTPRDTDTTVWEGTLPLDGSINPNNIRYMVQAVNGFGRIGRALNNGFFFTPGIEAEPNVETNVELAGNPTDGQFGDQITVKAILTGNGQPLSGQSIEFKLGPGLSARGITDPDGIATVTFNLVGLPGDTRLYASFVGTATYKPSSAVIPFTITRQPTTTAFNVESPTTIVSGQDSGIVATLKDADGKALRERGLFLVITDVNGNIVYTMAGITNLQGQIALGPVSPDSNIYTLPDTFTLTAYFNDNPLVSTLDNDAYESSQDQVALLIEPAPVVPLPCTTAYAVLHDPNDPTAEPESIWSPNGEFWKVDIETSGLYTVTIDSVFQDEEVGREADARLVDDGDNSLELRAERDGNGTGRGYHIFFTVDDGQGLTCDGNILIEVVEHDQSGKITGSIIYEGDLYNSTLPTKFAPEAVDDPVSTDEDNPVSGNVLANDIPAKNSDVLTVVAINGNNGAVDSPLMLASGATVTLNADGNFTYDPDGQFETLAAGGLITDTFDYTVSDNDGDVDIGTVIIDINGVNDAPVATDDSGTTAKDTPVAIDVLANDTDIDSAALTISQFSQSANGGSVSLLDGSLTYTPAAGFTGQDSFTYVARDDSLDSNTATVIVTVNEVNAPPLAEDDLATTAEDTAVEIDVGDNDSDPDGNLDKTSALVATPPANGTVTNNGNGVFTYLPYPGFSGTDSFVYRIFDTDGASDEATVTITITSVDEPPTAKDDTASININELAQVIINVTANDIDLDGNLDPSTVSITNNPAGGTATSNGNGTITYRPNEGFVGQDTFQYQVCDTTALCDMATVTVTVEGNRPPDAVDDTPDTAPQGTPVVIAVLENDTDEDGDTLTVVQFSQGDRGSVSSNADGTLTYTPNSNFRGTDTFTYTISDGRGGTDTATVTVTFGRN